MTRPTIRTAVSADREAIWSILRPVIRAGETYALDRDMDREAGLAVWMGPARLCFVAENAEGEILGVYYLKPNQAGGGSHVANCGYVTAEAARGRGFARQMCEHSLLQARKLGYKAMQYNLVVSTNRAAISLWHKLGFETVGVLPGAFQHPTDGEVDALVMHQRL